MLSLIYDIAFFCHIDFFRYCFHTVINEVLQLCFYVLVCHLQL